ncbi:MAG: hypothetical protein LBI85_02505, partial [Spirochaetaceae bacterium]|nr:hypothetical protein [Spirochaetaceae bacterium]
MKKLCKRPLVLVLGIIAIGALIASGLTGCDNPSGGDGGGGGIDKALVATWHSTQAVADAGTDVVFEITSGGKLIIAGQSSDADITVKTSGGTISATMTTGGQTVDGGSADYEIDGTTLEFSNLSLGGFNVFTPLKAGQDLSLGLGGAGCYYRKAGSSGNDNGNGKGNTDPKTLRITNISAAQASQGQSGGGFQVGIVERGTTPEQALDWIGVVAGGDSVELSSGPPYTATVELYNVETEHRWTGSGTYDIYLMIGSGSSVAFYQMKNVSFNSASTSVSAVNFVELDGSEIVGPGPVLPYPPIIITPTTPVITITTQPANRTVREG